MEFRNTARTLIVVLCFIQQVASVIIVPAPTVAVESATSTSITLNWTMPINELYDHFTIEILSPGETSRTIEINDTRLAVDNLTPGYIYTFSVTATRGDLISNATVIIQDTVPLPPSNLRLEAFQSLLLSMEGIFGTIQFTLQVPGILAEWEGPARGVCDCYEARITPPGGRVARPAFNERDSGVRTVREFIELIPGQTYTVTVRSTTCGHGYLGALKSRAINATITLPPSDPPPITPKRITNTSACLSWEEGGNITGFYDNFEVILLTNTSNNQIVIHTPPDLRTRGRNVSGLLPCTMYSFEVYTLNKGLRSVNSQQTELFTRPTPPSRLMVTNFNETSISVIWRHPAGNETAAFRVVVENIRAFFRPELSTSAFIGRLRPGTVYNVSVSTQCLGPSRTESVPVRITQTTIPLPPEFISATCVASSVDDVISTSISSSVISLTWTRPKSGDWDGFVVDYSPFEFEDSSSNPVPPILLSRNTYNLNITVPTTRNIYSVYIRSIRQQLLSSATSTDAECRDENGRSMRQCRIRRSRITIIMRIHNLTHFFVEIKGIKINNITVDLSDRNDDKFVTNETRFLVINPCNRVERKSLLNIVFYPLCDQDQSCLPITRKLCASILKDEDRSLALTKATNACCNGKAFHNLEEKCCHRNLVDLRDDNSQCCYTRWYDRTRQKCCGVNQNGGVVLPLSRTCTL